MWYELRTGMDSGINRIDKVHHRCKEHLYKIVLSGSVYCGCRRYSVVHKGLIIYKDITKRVLITWLRSVRFYFCHYIKQNTHVKKSFNYYLANLKHPNTGDRLEILLFGLSDCSCIPQQKRYSRKKGGFVLCKIPCEWYKTMRKKQSAEKVEILNKFNIPNYIV